VGYPLAIYVLSLNKKRHVDKDETFTPFVTIITAAYNEESGIEKTIQNKLELDYPHDRLEIIIVSDESTDGTDDIVKKFESKGVRLIRQKPRAGKTSALNLAVPLAKGEIIVFSDANSIYDPDVVKKLTRNFKDPHVGYVTGKMIYTNPDGSTIGDGCSTYMKYENMLRKFETAMGSVVGVDGGVDAIRKDLYRTLNPDQLPDFVQPLKVVEQGFRVVYEPDAILKEPALKEASDEYRMRVRVSLRALWALSDMRHLLVFPSNRLFSFQLWSHKVLRYLCFIFLITAFISNALLLSVPGFIYKVFFIIQISAYTGAFLSPVLENKGYQSKLLYLCRYFALLNIASAHAFMKFVLRQKQVVWTPRKG
jgi:cellulose synthase/poly-beta-1,6-N-acetylglucosamine synthase-like glycosyltransferase